MKQNQAFNNYLWVITAIFLSLAISFIFNLWGGQRERIHHPSVEDKYFTKNPVREAKKEAFIIQDGYRLSCNDCHQNLVPSSVRKISFSAHPDIILDHGVNDSCLTCHNRDNREKLNDINKEEVSFSNSQITCLQCHGPIYRDWENGVHGRMNDFWDSKKGVTRRLMCVDCHDPHNPKFKSMEPSPAPNIVNYKDFLDQLSVKESSHE